MLASAFYDREPIGCLRIPVPIIRKATTGSIRAGAPNAREQNLGLQWCIRTGQDTAWSRITGHS